MAGQSVTGPETLSALRADSCSVVRVGVIGVLSKDKRTGRHRSLSSSAVLRLVDHGLRMTEGIAFPERGSSAEPTFEKTAWTTMKLIDRWSAGSAEARERGLSILDSLSEVRDVQDLLRHLVRLKQILPTAQLELALRVARESLPVDHLIEIVQTVPGLQTSVRSSPRDHTCYVLTVGGRCPELVRFVGCFTALSK